MNERTIDKRISHVEISHPRRNFTLQEENEYVSSLHIEQNTENRNASRKKRDEEGRDEQHMDA